MVLQWLALCSWAVNVVLHVGTSPLFKRPLRQPRAAAGTTAEPKYDIYHLFLYLNCVLSIAVLLEDEHLLQSEIHSALEQVIIKDVYVWCCIPLSLILESFPLPAVEKHPYSVILPPPGVAVVMVLFG